MLRPLIGLITKEFRQVFRDGNMVRMIFAMPVIQLLLFGYVVNLDVKNISLDVYDLDRSQQSREFVHQLEAGDYFAAAYPELAVYDLEKRFFEGKADMSLIIPPQFDQQLDRGVNAQVGIVADASNANQTSIGVGYLQRIAQEYSLRRIDRRPPLDVRTKVLYNPEMQSVYYMVPGIVATLLTMITVMLTSMAIVREREMGTLEQLMVTPISRLTFLLGKLIPFAILGMVVIIVALSLGVVWFDVPFIGSPVLLFSIAFVYLGTTLGIGLLISTYTSTQQQAMFFAWFFFVFAMLTSGFFTPIANMPHWMQIVTYINPMRYFMSIARAIMMKGSGPLEIWHDVYPLFIYPLLVTTIAVFRFSKRAS